MQQEKKLIFGLAFIFFSLLLTSCSSHPLASSPLILTSLSSQDFSSLLTQNSQAVLLDLHTPQEFSQGHIARAINMDFYNASFTYQLSFLERNKTYFIYCHSGARSAVVLEMMRSENFTSVYNLKSGIVDWQAHYLPLV